MHSLLCRCQYLMHAVGSLKYSLSTGTIMKLCTLHNLRFVYLATNTRERADVFTIEQHLYEGVNGPIVVRTFPHERTHQAHRTGPELPAHIVPIVELLICSHAAVFVGTWPSTYSALVFQQRTVCSASATPASPQLGRPTRDVGDTYFWGVDDTWMSCAMQRQRS